MAENRQWRGRCGSSTAERPASPQHLQYRTSRHDTIDPAPLVQNSEMAHKNLGIDVATVFLCKCRGQAGWAAKPPCESRCFPVCPHYCAIVKFTAPTRS